MSTYINRYRKRITQTSLRTESNGVKQSNDNALDCFVPRNDGRRNAFGFVPRNDGRRKGFRTFLLAALLLAGGIAQAQVVIEGNVYGGCNLGQVKNPAANVYGNTTVTINDGTVEGSVFGGGEGSTDDRDHGLVEGNTLVDMKGGTVERSIYGGGSLGSVGTFTEYYTANTADGHHFAGEPKVCNKKNTGVAKVLISGGKVGIDGSLMPIEGANPDDDDRGWIFCGSRGEADSITYPKANILAFVDSTYLEISGTALITASVYGGSENGQVLRNTHVKITSGQIGTGLASKTWDTDHWETDWDGVYPETGENSWATAKTAVESGNVTSINAIAGHFHECDHWPYGIDHDNDDDTPDVYYVYDYFADPELYPDYDSHGGATLGSSGHSFFGNVFGGGSGYYPIAPGVWRRTAGRVLGNTTVDITGGHILSNIYGGNEITDVYGTCTINMSGGTLGVPRTLAKISENPVTCYLFGAGMGDSRDMFNTWTNVASTKVNISGDAFFFGSVFGGGEDGHVLGDAETTIEGNVHIGTWGYSSVDGNVFGGGRGFSGNALTDGAVVGNVILNIKNGTILGNVYGGGRLSSVGAHLVASDDDNYGNLQSGSDHGHITINITGGTIGNDHESKLNHEINAHDQMHTKGGNVYGGSMGRIANLDNETVNPLWPNLGKVKKTTVNISGNSTIIKGSVFGGGESGVVTGESGIANATEVKLSSGTIWRNVYGGGFGSDNTTMKAHLYVNTEGTNPEVTPMQRAGLVEGNTKVTIEGGWVKKSVYGGGALASTGIIADSTKHADETTSFALSWPYEMNYQANTGQNTVEITGGRIGITGKDFMGPWNESGDPMVKINGNYVAYDDSDDEHKAALKAAREDNGDVFGAAKGLAGDRYVMAHMGNASNAVVTVNYTNTDADPTNYVPSDWQSAFYPTAANWTTYGTRGCIAGSLYGGGENGHVLNTANVTLTKGLIGHALYGGGKGKDTYTVSLKNLGSDTEYHDAEIYSLTAGKVYGNTSVTVNAASNTDAYVLRNIYGGGNMASVGKGNYAGGADDYSTAGYGEKVDSLWTGGEGSDAWHFRTSGKTTVTVTGGTVGTASGTKDGLPTGNVFGGCRGEAAPNILNSPRYEYAPAFFSGYVNKTDVTIGRLAQGTEGEEGYVPASAPVIYGSVYGGGQDGHVRRSTNVTINGDIGLAYNEANISAVGTNDLTDAKWLYRGNVFGGGSGISKYEYDLPPYDGVIDENYSFTYTYNGRTYTLKEKDYSNSSGSVTDSTTVVINSGTVYRNIYGGGSLATVGPPFIPGTINTDDELGKPSHWSMNTVNVNNGTVGELDGVVAGYGGHVFGAGRGDATLDFEKFSTSVQTSATVGSTGKNALVHGNLYGGGEIGQVSDDTEANVVSGGTVGTIAYTDSDDDDTKDGITHTTGGKVFGGGKGLSDSDKLDAARVKGNSNVNISGGKVYYNVYGGGEVASVGQHTDVHADPDDPESAVIDYAPKANTGLASVTVTGGQVGPAPKVESGYSIPVGLNGFDGNIFGGGQGIGDDEVGNNPADENYPGQYHKIANVNYTRVEVNITSTDTLNNRIWGSVFGGSEDGHVLGSDTVYYKSGFLGTNGKTNHDGNIFGGGRNYHHKNYTAGRTRGNTYVEMTGGQVFGNIYGGGRLALTGCGLRGLTVDNEGNFSPMLDGHDDFGNTKVLVKGGKVGNNKKTNANPEDVDEMVIETFSDYSMGNVYGGGKGEEVGIDVTGHPKASALMLGMTKNTEVEVSGTHEGTRVYGIVFGGGETANVGQYSWKVDGSTGQVHSINITEGLAKVTISGGTIGADRAKMRYEAGDAPYNMYPKYNDDLGYVYGGGEGISDDPNNTTLYPQIYADGMDQPTISLLDLMATVNNTEVEITGTAWVKASVFGGGENGHVRGDTKVTISGGTVGAGNNTVDDRDEYYDDDDFINPALNSLYGTAHWPYGATIGGNTVYHPYDPVYVMNGTNPSDGRSWFGNVFGGGSGWFPYITGDGTTVHPYQSNWNANSGRVWGNTEVIITGGHILNNVYGGNESTDVGDYGIADAAYHTANPQVPVGAPYWKTGGTATVTMSGGTIGVPRDADKVLEQPTTGNLFGGGAGDPRRLFNIHTNVDTTDVRITGGTVYGAVFGGAEMGHVLRGTSVNISQAEGKTTVIGSSGFSGYDGHVFGGGKGDETDYDPYPASGDDDPYPNFACGRVGGNTKVTMSSGTVFGNLYGGGMIALTGVDAEGSFESYITGTEYDSIHHGKTEVDLSGGTIGNNANDGLDLLMSNSDLGNVYGGGRGNPEELREDDLGRVANAVTSISGSPTIYGSVFGGGQMANVGHWRNYGTWYTTNTGTTKVTITGSPTIGLEKEFDHEYSIGTYGTPKWTWYDTINNVKMISHTCTGNVFGGGQGDVEIDDGTFISEGTVVGFEQGHCRTTRVEISGTPTIRSTVFGGGEDGVVWGDTWVTISGGTIGTPGITSDSLEYNETTHEWHTLDNHATYSFGSVFGGSFGKDVYTHIEGVSNPTEDQLDSINGLAGRVLGNTRVDITGGQVHGNVYGGGNMASVGYWNTLKNGNQLVDLVPAAYPDITGPLAGKITGNATVNISGSAVIGPLDETGLNAYVFGGGKGFHEDPAELRKAYCNVDSTFVTVSGGKVWGSVFGGGNDAHVLGSTSVIVHEGADLGRDGLSTWDGNIFGGGRNFLNSNHSNGRVAGNVKIEMDGGTMQGSIFGGGRMALTGVNPNGVFPASDWDVTKHGNVTINVSGTATTSDDVTTYSTVIGNGSDQGIHLLTESDESVGDIFGSGKGDTKNYDDIQAGCVTNATITITGSPRIHGSVFGGGEMASLGWWDADNNFIDNTGKSEITIGREGTAGANDNPVIGTYLELDPDYISDNLTINGHDYEHSDWTIIETDDDGVKRVFHTCTGNVIGGCQGDVDFEDWVNNNSATWNNWPYMARSNSSIVTINRGTIMGHVFGGSEQGTVDGNAHVTINGGTIGTLATATDNTPYNFGGVFGAGYGSDDPEEDDHPITVNGNSTTAKMVAGRLYGNTQVDVLGGTIQGDVFGGASFAYVGNGTTTGDALTNIGNASQYDQPSVGTTIKGSVFGANNRAGTPYGDVTVHVYSTAHTTANTHPEIPAEYTTEEQILAWLATQPYADENFAIKAVYGGSNHADYTPVSGKQALVYVHECEENTIKDVYGGSNAADIGSITAGYKTNANVIIDGGRIYRVFGGGNGEVRASDIHGTATTEVKGGLINQVFGGSNSNGVIDEINLNINYGGSCDLYIEDVFSGGNEALVLGDVTTTVECCDASYGNFYGGTRLANIYGDVTVNIFGATFGNLFAGSQGQLADDTTEPPTPAKPANIKRFPSTIPNPLPQPEDDDYDEELDQVYRYMQAELAADPPHDLRGHGGNVTLNLFGGTITNAFGGSDVNGNIEGKIQVNVLNVGGNCNLDIDTIFGAGRNTAYTPDYALGTGETERLTPEINVIHGTVKGNVFGGGMGETATTTASPVVNMGYYSDLGVYGHEGDLIDKLFDTIHDHTDEPGAPWVAPATYAAFVKGNMFGGGELAQVEGNTYVFVQQGVVGDSIGRIENHLGADSTFYGLYAYQLRGGRVFGGGEGSDDNKDHGLVTGNTTVTMTGGQVYRNVYGGGELASVGTFTYDTQATDSVVAVASGTGLATVNIKGGELGPLDGSGQNAYVFGGSRGKVIEDGPNPYVNFANVGSTVVTVCDSARIYGSIFGGGEDGHVLGDAHVYVQGSTKDTIPIIGTNAKTSWDGNIFGGGRNFAYVNNTAGRVAGNIQVDMSDGKLLGNLYGGGRLGLTGMNANGDSIAGTSHGYITVNVSGGTIGLPTDTITSGNVFGGGKGIYENPTNPYVDVRLSPTLGRVKQTNVTISDNARIHGSVYGGGELAKVTSNTNVRVTEGTIGTEVPIGGGTPGTRYNGSVFGGGKGYDGIWADYGIVSPGETFGDTYVTIEGGQVMENVYGGAEMALVGTYTYDDDGYLNGYTKNGHTHVTIKGGEIGPLDGTGMNGYVIGGGQGKGNDPYNYYKHLNTVGSTYVKIEDGAMVYGSVLGGAAEGHVWDSTKIEITGGTIGTTGYTGLGDGNVIGGGGNMSESNRTSGRVGGNVKIKMSDGHVMGNLYGGGYAGLTGVDEDGEPYTTNLDQHGNVDINISGGTVGILEYIRKKATASTAALDSIDHHGTGSVFGGGKGSTTADATLVTDLGLVTGNTLVTIGGGHVYNNVYGGGEMGSVGRHTGTADFLPVDNTGYTKVKVTGGQVGPAPKEGTFEGVAYNIPIGLNGTDGYVFGGGKGDGDDASNAYKNFANVNYTCVEIDMPIDDGTHANRLWGSIFGGAEDGHVLGSDTVYYKNGLLGTYGTTSYDGNIFGGGRNYSKKNYTAGRTRGNITVEMEGGQLYGSIFGGGRLAITGIGLNGNIIPGNDYGHVSVKVSGGTVGNDTEITVDETTMPFIQNFTKFSMGEVFGGGKGDMQGIAGHPTASALLISLVKNTKVEISGTAKILGNVYGGGEVANVGQFTWEQPDASTIQHVQLTGGGHTEVTIKGGQIGADRMKMDYHIVGGSGSDKYNLRYNTDVGHVFGGGKGRVDNPANWGYVNVTYDGTTYVDERLLDVMATVNTTEVNIKESAYVKGSVFGGSMSGHVLDSTYVEITGGQIGAGKGATDLQYDPVQFVDPAEATVTDSLSPTEHWVYGKVYDGVKKFIPFDPILVSQDTIPSDGRTWFGNVYGGGSGYYPYIVRNHNDTADSTVWNMNAGMVRGNTRVEMTGGHVLSSVYGGNETTDVGGRATVIIAGSSTVKPTVGVPRVESDITALPLPGYVYGSGNGDPRTNFNTCTNVASAHVKIDKSIVYGSVFGGGLDGHVLGDARVRVESGTIGTFGTTGAEGNVFGGGRGSNPVALTAGGVGGNTYVDINDGRMFGSIFGGGNNGSVGIAFTDPTASNYGEIKEDDGSGTYGYTTVNINGGTIGHESTNTEDRVGGNVYGGCRGTAGAPGSIVVRMAKVKQTQVNIREASGKQTFIMGSVFGSGEDGHVMKDTYVNVYAGQIGGDDYKTDINEIEKCDDHFHGNVYGGGRGLDTYKDEHGDDQYSVTAGKVNGNTHVTVKGGHIVRNVYGGGNLASVGDPNETPGSGGVYTTGLATVNILGGTIGTPNIANQTTHPDLSYGNVFGSSHGIANSNYSHLAYVKNTHVTIDSVAQIYGSVLGGGEDGHVRHDTRVDVQGGFIYKTNDDDFNGNVYGAGRGFVTGTVSPTAGEVYGHTTVNIQRSGDHNGTTYTPYIEHNVYGGGSASVVQEYKVVNISDGLVKGSVFGGSRSIPDGRTNKAPRWLNMWGGTVEGNLYGCSHSSTDGDPANDQDFASFINLSGGTVGKVTNGTVSGGNVYGAGDSGTVKGSVAILIGKNAIDNAPISDNTNKPATVTKAKLDIKGSVYAGSEQSTGLTWGAPAVTGSSNIYIDGYGYNTTSDDPTTDNYMHIGGGIYGSGENCEASATSHDILLKDYGTRTPTGDAEMTAATRTLTTIQRGGQVLLDGVNVKLSGATDISSTTDLTNYGVLNIGTSLMVANASGIVLGETGTPAYMDSIKQVRSLHLKSGTAYASPVWEWIGITGSTPEGASLVYHESAPTTPLGKANENVILFKDASQLHVRYTEGTTTKYGELQGFFRMRSDAFGPYGTESFAYARPKITDGSSPVDNNGDGGFLSYVAADNFHTDYGTANTNTNQHPYINVLFDKGDRTEYRLWAIPSRAGMRWYVDGRNTTEGGWGSDAVSKINGAGRFPDKPKKTLFGTVSGGNLGGVISETFTSVDEQKFNYLYSKDHIYVVGALSAADEAALLCDSIGEAPDYKHTQLRLYRYPGGHTMSNGERDYGTGTTPVWGVAANSHAGPGANYGAMLNVQPNQSLELRGVVIDGLYDFTTTGENPDVTVHDIPTATNNPECPAFVPTSVTKPLIITHSGSTLTLNDSIELMHGYNNTDAANTWYTNADYTTPSGTYHGGALFVGENATVNVNGLVTITGNLQKNGSGTVNSNVYLPTFGKYLNITDALDATTHIGVTSPIRNNEASYLYNTFSPVAVANKSGATDSDNATIASNAWTNGNFTDDQDWFFGKGDKKVYYANIIPDHPGYIEAAETTSVVPAKTLFFGWTWANVVRTAPSGFDLSNINSAEDMAWLISKSAGMNGETATNFGSQTLSQTADVDLQQYVWVPLGEGTTETPVFAGTFDGRGHLIENLYVKYIGKHDARYKREHYGMFGVVNGGTIDRTFVVSGEVSPADEAITIGGLVGSLSGTLRNSEAAADLKANSNEYPTTLGGLVGELSSGEVHSSMAMTQIDASGIIDITTPESPHVGGLVGVVETSTQVKNSFAKVNGIKVSSYFDATNPSFDHFVPLFGGLVGQNKGTVENNYVVYSNSFTNHNLSTTNFGMVVGKNEGSLDYCYFPPKSSTTYDSIPSGGGSIGTNCHSYTPVASSDTYGYMHLDNSIKYTGNHLTDTAMFVRLNQYLASDASHKYARWARPALSGINGDLPVLLLENYNASNKEGAGGFRSMTTYNGGSALQYHGPVRDGEGSKVDNEIDAAISAMTATDNELFVYGDINVAPTATVPSAATNAKISFHEDVALLNAGSLASFTNNYVGITFDNSSRHAHDFYGIRLGRDWHMMSTPLKDAPLGIDYEGENTASGPIYYYLQSPKRYGFTSASASGGDGYFPSQTTGYTKPEDEPYAYPYDYYCWYEPDWQWINFKRNGPSHWHQDDYGGHAHIPYNPGSYQLEGGTVINGTPNVNETKLLPGKGYMMAIQDNTFMQSHGQLNQGWVKINITNQADGTWTTWGGKGNNLIGNPYHAYLDFDLFAKSDDSKSWNSPNNGKIYGNNYYVYDADKNNYITYPAGGSKGGDYAPRYLHPHQGFIILTEQPSDELTFNEDMLKTREVGASDFRDEEQPAYPLVNLYADDANGNSEVLVVEFERPENGGGRKSMSLRNGNHLLYAHFEDENYSAFFAVKGTKQVPVRFKTFDTEGVYTMRWNIQNGTFASIYLIDNIAGVKYDMNRHQSYVFEASKTDYLSRFLIVFNYTDVEELPDEHHPFAFFDGTEWVVNGNGILQLIDVTGRVLYDREVAGDQTRISLKGYAKGVYLLRLIEKDTTKTQKLVWK